jgi:hypothetical protein
MKNQTSRKSKAKSKIANPSAIVSFLRDLFADELQMIAKQKNIALNN